MPVHNVGDKTNLDKGDLFVQLKAKGEKINFRLAQPTYTYDAKHFTKQDGKWLIEECSRLMVEAPCDTCEKFFELKKQWKEAKDNKASADEVKRLDDEVGKYKPKTTFYYAILNRDDKRAQILQVPLMIRLKIDEYFSNGFSVVGSDFILTRTEKPGSEYYSFLRMDSADVKKLDKDEEAEFKKAEQFNIEELTLSKKGSQTYEDPPMPEEDA